MADENKKNADKTVETDSAPIEEIKITAPEPAPIAPTMPAVNTSEKDSLISTKLSEKEKAEFLKKRRSIPIWLLILKYVSILLLLATSLGFVWFMIDLEPKNKYLGFFNLGDNMVVRYKKLIEKKESLASENQELIIKINIIKNKIKNKEYSVHTEQINNLVSEQLVWFDRKSTDNEIAIGKPNILYGLLNSPNHMQQYFMSDKFKNLILVGENDIEINDISATRKELSFKIHSTNLFNKVFLLNTEFIKMMNSFPFLRDGKITKFMKKHDKAEGEYVMDFSVKFKIQKHDEVDPADDYFSEYEKWENS